MSHKTLADLRSLTPITASSVITTPRGKRWFQSVMNENMDKLTAYYGDKIPVPHMAIEEDDETLCVYWECGDDPVYMRLDADSWDWT